MEGTRVRAVKQVTEDGCGEGNTAATFPMPDYIHAEPGDLGTAYYDASMGNTTVKFDRTGTATIVRPDEIEPA